MPTWIYRFLLFMLLFGVSALTYGGNSLNPILDKVTNVSALLGIPALIIGYPTYPRFYKVMAWPLLLGAILLVLESKYEYGQYVYSFFVIKRFVYCGLALSAFYVAARAEPFRFALIPYLILAFFFINQILLGQIFSYALTSETRSTTAPEALYLVIPFLYYLVLYLKEHRFVHLLASLLTFAFIVFLLHRTVISTAVVAAGMVVGLAGLGRLTTTMSSLPIGRTLSLFIVLVTLLAPLSSLLPESKLNSFTESIGGILDPEEDNTGSWRVEQSTFYLSQVPERPWFGWRYDGYDRGEIMENEDFPDKGTIIHSQYVDMLYNYGAVGLALNLLLILGTLVVMYRQNSTFSTEQLVLFGFAVGGLIYAVSYQLPVGFWGFLGLGMHYGLKHPSDPEVDSYSPNQEQPDALASPVTLPEQPIRL